MMTTTALQGCKKSAIVAAAVLTLGLASERAEALTVLLNFVAGPSTDRNNVGTLPETFASWGFAGMSLNDIRDATLAAVQNHYLGYPTFGTNALSPLPDGFRLNINFEWSNGQTAPVNGWA